MSNEEKITSIKSDNNSGDSSDALDPRPEDRALLEELKNLTIKRTFDVKTLSPKVTKRVLFLKDIQVKHDELEEKFLEEKAALEAKYDDLYKPLFDKGHEGKFSIYIHPSKERPVHISRHFSDRKIHSDEVTWGRISMVDAEKRLLVNALEDPDNQHFVLLSESCIPLHTFDYTYRYLLYSNVSFIESFVDLGPHGTGRHMEHMLPEIAKEDFRKGAQRGIEADKNCIADEHYLPTFFSMIDPMGISNWSVTYVDWSERRWHPKTYGAHDVSLEFMKNVTSEDMSVHVTSIDGMLNALDVEYYDILMKTIDRTPMPTTRLIEPRRRSVLGKQSLPLSWPTS